MQLYTYKKCVEDLDDFFFYLYIGDLHTTVPYIVFCSDFFFPASMQFSILPGS